MTLAGRAPLPEELLTQVPPLFQQVWKDLAATARTLGLLGEGHWLPANQRQSWGEEVGDWRERLAGFA